jgi:hypothetical protein
VRHVGERLSREQRQGLGRHLEDVDPVKGCGRHVVAGQLAVFGPIRGERKHLLKFEFVHGTAFQSSGFIMGKRLYLYQPDQGESRQFSNKQGRLQFRAKLL